MAKSAREMMKERLRGRSNQAAATGKMSLFSMPRYFTIPKRDGADVSIWRPTSGKKDEKKAKHNVDIIPFQVGEWYPTRNEYNLRAGDWHYMLDVRVHRNVGPENIWVICPFANYGEPCPICEHAKELYAEATSEEETKKITAEKWPKRRNLFNVWVHDDADEEAKGVQLWEDAYFFVGKNLEEEAQKNPDGDGAIEFYFPDDEGRQVEFQVVAKSSEEMEYCSFFLKKRLDGKRKPYTIPDEILDQAFCLDELIKDKLMSYDDLKELYWGNGGKTEPKKKDDKKKDEKAETATGTRRQRQQPPPPKEEPEPVPPEDDEPQDSGDEPGDDEPPFDPDNPACPFGHEFGADHSKQALVRDCERCPDEAFAACGDKKKELEDEAKKRSSGPAPRRRLLGGK